MDDPGKGIFEKTKFYGIKLPLILVLICLGYLLDFVVQLPFALMCTPIPGIRSRLRKNRRVKNLPISN